MAKYKTLLSIKIIKLLFYVIYQVASAGQRMSARSAPALPTYIYLTINVWTLLCKKTISSKCCIHSIAIFMWMLIDFLQSKPSIDSLHLSPYTKQRTKLIIMIMIVTLQMLKHAAYFPPLFFHVFVQIGSLWFK